MVWKAMTYNSVNSLDQAVLRCKRNICVRILKVATKRNQNMIVLLRIGLQIKW
jgi:hypothetical protein